MSFPPGKSMLIALSSVLLLSLLQVSAADSAMLHLEKSAYQLGEPVYFVLNSNASSVSLVMKFGNELYKFFEPGNLTVFIPRAAGNYTVELISSSDSSVIQSKEFTVEKKVEMKQASGISIDSPIYRFNDPVKITVLTDSPKDLLVKSQEKIYKFFDVGSETMQFRPREAGLHTIELLAKNGSVEDTQYFDVGQEQLVSLDKNEIMAITVKDHRSAKRPATLRILPSGQPDGPTKRRSDVELKFEGESHMQIRFSDFDLANSGEVGLDDVPAAKVKIGKKSALNAFAIDPSQLSFSNASFTATARGKELYKCAQWNFSFQVCEGVWIKIMDLEPGSEYTVQFNSSDPAYAETGVASINSRKSIYKPGELAELIIVVLDTAGHLVSGANVVASITSPSNETLVIIGIQESSPGIYEFAYNNTAVVGNYSLFINALGPSVNSTMISYFTVLADYPFDILRSTPVTTDPWRGPFVSSVTIVSLGVAGEFSFSERLPANFTVVDAGGATIVESNLSKILTWSGLSNGSTITYSAYPPFVTPDLHEIGPGRVDFSGGSFEEARSWFLAVDPEIPAGSMGMIIYADTANAGFTKWVNWTGTALSAEQNSNVAQGSAITWQDLACSKSRRECYKASQSTGGMLNFAIFDQERKLWHNATNLSSTAPSTPKAFDIACEDLRGDCIIAYEINTANNNIFSYRYWNGSKLGPPTNVTVTPATNFDFLRIEMFPKPNSSDIGIAFMNDGGGGGNDMYGGLWNGSSKSFGNFNTFTTNGRAGENQKSFDCAWEGASAKMLCIYGTQTNDVNAVRWNNSGWESLGDIYSAFGQQVTEVEMCGSTPQTGGLISDNRIGIVMCGDQRDFDGGIWNGTSFSKAATSDTPSIDGDSNCHTNKVQQDPTGFGCAREKSGDQFVFVWTDKGNSNPLGGTYTVSSDTWSTATWGSGTATRSAGSNDVNALVLSANPVTDEVFISDQDDTPSMYCSYWNGTSFLSTGCGLVENSGSNEASQVIYFDWTRFVPHPVITILEPANKLSNYTFGGMTSPSSMHVAYNGSTSEDPPSAANSPITGLEVATAGYTNLSSSDNARYMTTESGATGKHAYQSFLFLVNDSIGDILYANLTYEGFATRTTSQTADRFNISVYNYSSDSYMLLYAEPTGSTSDLNIKVSLPTNISSLIRSGVMYFLVEGIFVTASGGSARADVVTDFIGLTVETSPVLSGVEKVNVTATDGNGVAACIYSFYNKSTSVAGPTWMSNATAQNFYNTTDTSTMPDWILNLTVTCNSTRMDINNATLQVRVDNTAPTINLISPANNSNHSSSSLNISWNVTDNFPSTYLCNLTVNGTVRAANLVTDNALTRIYAVSGLLDGRSNWSVTCVDAGFNSITSVLHNFEIDATAPVINLTYPAAGQFVNNRTLNLSYLPTDSSAIANCSLTLNGILNWTVFAIASNAYNNFSLQQVVEGTYNWAVNCSDAFGNSGNSTTNNFTLDATPPSVYLNTSSGMNFSGGVAQLNFTAYDNLDSLLSCNITINGAVASSGINATNSTLTQQNLSVVDGVKYWNVTCVDDAGNSNTSETRNFSLSGGPVIDLFMPADNFITLGENITFAFNATDGDGLAACSLVIDSILNQTSTSIQNGGNNSFNASIRVEGNHNWSVNCSDTGGTMTISSSRNLIVDRFAPQVNLSNPVSGTMILSATTQFNFTMVDSISSWALCNLTVDGSVVAAGMNVTNNSAKLQNQTILNGVHYWNVTCTDRVGNSNFSSTWNFTVNVTFPVNLSVQNDKQQYVSGEMVFINVTSRNESALIFPSNVTLDIIYTNLTNTTARWWNVSWARRRPLMISEFASRVRLNKVFSANITNLNGFISNCDAGLRVVSTELEVKPFNTLTGDNSTYCYIIFEGNASANAVNETNFHVYFNTTGPSSAGFAGIRNSSILFQDEFEDLLLDGWFPGPGWNASIGTPLPGRHARVSGNTIISSIPINHTLDLSSYDWVNISASLMIESGWDANEFIKLEVTTDAGSVWAENTTNLTANASGLDGAFDSSSGNFVNSRVSDNSRFQVGASTTLRGNMTLGYNISGISASQVSGLGGFIEYCHQRQVGDSCNNNYRGTPGSMNIWIQNASSGSWLDVGDIAASNTETTTVWSSRGNASNFVNATGWVNIKLEYIFTADNAAFALDYAPLVAKSIQNGSAVPIWINLTQVQGNVNEGSELKYNSRLDPNFYTSQFNARFRAIVDEFADDGGFDNVTITAIREISINASVLVGGDQIFINRTDNQTTGNFVKQFNTSGHNPGLYTSVGYAASAGMVPGNAADDFELLTDVFGPIVTLSAPPNASARNSGSFNFTYTPNDLGSVVSNCSLILNGVRNQTNQSIVEEVSNNFSVSSLTEGIFQWSVNCSDTLGNVGSSTAFVLYVDDTSPSVVALTPNGTATQSSSINFNFSATDNFASVMLCNVSVDNGIYSNSGYAANNTVKTITINSIPDGLHYWNVSCADNASNNGFSQTLNFSIDAAPTVALADPIGGYGTNWTNITLYFNITESNLNNCSLILNNQTNQTKNSSLLPFQSNNGTNNFTLSGLGQGVYNWSVSCIDINGFSGNSTSRLFYIDFGAPVIIQHNPGINETVYTTNITFNFTATDEIDPALLCNISVNGLVNVTGVSATSGVPTSVISSGFSAGNYTWNVTCVDNALFSNNSGSRNFTVTSQPRVTLVTPANNSADGDGDLNLVYLPQSIATFDAPGFCELFFDNVSNLTEVSVLTGQQNSFGLSSVNQGLHSWLVNCSDQNLNAAWDGPWFVTVDLEDPTVLANNPNTTTLNNSRVTFNFTATDNLATTLSCNITVNGSLRASGISAVNGSLTLVNVSSFRDGLHLWNVTCADTGQRSNTSNQLNFTVMEPPIISLLSPVSGNRTRNINTTFTFTAADNSGAISMCMLVLNGGKNQTNVTITNGSTNSIVAQNLSEGSYNWTVNCTDPSGNVGINASAFLYTIDLQGPYGFNLTYPANDSFLNSGDVAFNFTAYDLYASSLSCNITLDGQFNQSDIPVTSGEWKNVTIFNISQGPHSWSMTCLDDLGNSNMSLSYNFTVNAPDLFTIDQNLSFNNLNPDVNETVYIYLNVSNIGGANAVGILVQFWDGIPGSGGTQITNTTINVPSGNHTLANVSWNITEGFHRIFALVDPLNNQFELSDTNNNATRNISTLIARILNPANNTRFSSTLMALNFTVADYNGTTVNYTIYDGDLAINSSFAPDAASTLINITLGDGIHFVRVQAKDLLGRHKNSTAYRYIIDVMPPITDFITANGTWFTDSTPQIDFNMTDNLSINLNYTIFIGGLSNVSGNTTNNTLVSVNITELVNGTYDMLVQGTDEAGNVRNSSILRFFIDTDPPQPFITTVNNTAFNTQSPQIVFNITDNLAPNINYTFFVENQANTTGSVANGTPSTAGLSKVPEGFSNVTLMGTDLALNKRNSTTIRIFVDVTPPNIVLLGPPNATNYTSSQVQLNFSANDNLAATFLCNLSVDNIVLDANINVSNGSMTVRNVTVSNAGAHLWNVSCQDNVGNQNGSVTWRFDILPPDFALYDANFTFNNTNPIEGDLVNVSAVVHNVGYIDGFNVTVHFFDVAGASVLLGNYTLPNLSVGVWVNLSVVWNVTVGSHTISAYADINNTVLEANETNNNISRQFNISSYDIRAGNLTGILSIDDAANATVYTWAVGNFTGTNIFAVDADDTPYFASLQPLGLNTSNASALDDFTQADSVLNSTTFTDSINFTWTSGGAPVALKNFTIFKRGIYNVRVVNSSNSSNFVTGLLWDSRNSTDYNGTQTLYVVTEVNQSSFGRCGLCDFEIKIPTNLRKLRPADQSRVIIYVEIR